MFHLTGNSYGTNADQITVNCTSGIDLVLSGAQVAYYEFGKVTVNGPVQFAPLIFVKDLINGDVSLNQSDIIHVDGVADHRLRLEQPSGATLQRHHRNDDVHAHELDGRKHDFHNEQQRQWEQPDYIQFAGGDSDNLSAVVWDGLPVRLTCPPCPRRCRFTPPRCLQIPR